MATNTIDATLVQKMFLAGAKNLESKKEWINDLNVFPVPDGDTGTNMTMTIMSAAKEVSSIANPTMENLAKAISTGSLRGARGNSGVILSQLLRGFTKEMSSLKEITVENLAAATQRATETAYKAVMKPKEGTILTVARGISEKAAEVASQTENLEEALLTIIEHAEYVLSTTPDLLPVLKEAGVVDSGGQGLVVVLRGMYDALTGKVTEFDISEPKVDISEKTQAKGAAIDNVDIKFGYCTEFIIMLDKEFNEKTEQEFKAFLSSIGDSIVCVALDDIVKVHVHTNHPGQAFEKALCGEYLSFIEGFLQNNFVTWEDLMPYLDYTFLLKNKVIGKYFGMNLDLARRFQNIYEPGLSFEDLIESLHARQITDAALRRVLLHIVLHMKYYPFLEEAKDIPIPVSYTHLTLPTT